MQPTIHFSTGDILVLIAFLAMVLWVGYSARRHLREDDATGYLVAGRTLTLPAFVATLVATWYGGILGVGEFSYSYGVSNWVVFGLPYYVFALLFAWWLAPRVREAELYTIPDRFYGIYGRACGFVGSLLTFCMTTPAPYTLILGVLFQLLFGGDLLVWLIMGTILSTVYLYRGGLHADVRVNVLEFLMMFAGFAVILPFLVSRYGGLEFLRQNLPPLHLTWHGGNSLQYILVWFFIALWTLIDPGFHQRCYAARSPAVARWGIVVSVCCWFVFDLMTTTAGLYARAILGAELSDPKFAYPVLAERVLPPVVKGVFFVGMFATVMSTVVSYTFLSAVTFGRDLLWRWRGGDENRALRYTRWGITLVGVIAIGLAWKVQSVVNLWYLIGSVFIPGLLLPLVGSYTRRLRVTPPFALATMGMGFGTSLGWMIYGTVSGKLQDPAFLQPMYPGLAVAIVVYAVGIAYRRVTSARERLAARTSPEEG
ncbi:MAG: sodium:solute symporter family protein [Armatimonadota bacterium]|nr:sodium:solute symporter family protein [Armatimonadota bacterium]